MFGTNDIVGRKFFKSAGGRLLVTSVFYTLQGEGPFAGRPAVFVRLTHCNLQCSFCDTSFSHGEWMTRDDLFNHMLDACSLKGAIDEGFFKDKVLVITGGEPMLQKALTPWLTFMTLYFDKVQIESNGLQLVDMPPNVVLVVSPKVPHGRMNYRKLPERVAARASCLKFVLSADHTSPYHTVPEWAMQWRKDTRRPVYVSPMAEYALPPGGTNGDLAERTKAERISFWQPGLLDLHAVRANHEYAAAYALHHGLHLSMQMQLFLNLP